MLQSYLKILSSHNHLTYKQAQECFEIIMSGQAKDTEIAAFLMALSILKPHTDEISAGAEIMRKYMTPIQKQSPSIDIVGTGGDNLQTYNISTACAIVTAAYGMPVTKHGNRSASSRSGAADVLEKIGVTLVSEPKILEDILQKIGLVFLFAPNHHAAIKHVMPARKDLGIATIFNLLGPLCNPASPEFMLLGVNNTCWLEPMAKSLMHLGVKKAWIVCGDNHIDEMNISGTTHVVELNHKTLTSFDVKPEDAGLKRYPITDIQCHDSSLYAPALFNIFDGEKNAYYNAVLFNTAAALVISGKANTLVEGTQKAAHVIDSKKAKNTLSELIQISKKVDNSTSF